MSMNPYLLLSAGIICAAFATSSPELSVSLTSALAGTPQIALGDALGSNIFNTLFIVGVAASIHPIVITPTEVAIGSLLGLLATAVVFPGKNGRFGRERGWVLLALYAAYLGLILQKSVP
jgi:cation:H+ antiporter